MIPLEWTLAVLFLFGGLNDAFLDLVFYVAPLRRWLGQGRANPRCEEAELHGLAEKRIAIMVPAWDESAVIGAMLESTCDRLEYSNYDVFVGTYPNDEPTQMEVARAAFDRPNVHRVVCPNDGPTSKADCLNWIVETIKLRETESGERYEIFCLQDAEDVVHPLTLKVFNRFVPEYDLVQLPVIPYERALKKLTGGTYLDEFAEVHLKGLTSRLAVGGMVPSAGVGTAFSRAACDELAAQTNHVLFPPVSLTEDYDFSFRLFRNGRKSGIAEVWVDRADAAGRLLKELVAIREFFPANFGDAVRQKQRWMLGIAFQGAQKLGWGTGWRERYMLLRDRIGVLSSLLNLAALFIFFRLYVDIGWSMAIDHRSWAQSLPGFYPSHALTLVIEANLVLLGNRVYQRARCVGQVASRRQMMLAPVRLVWSNVIDFYCTFHAIRRFTHATYSGKPLKWLKTAHEFPNVEALLQRHRPLGDLLLEHRFLSPLLLRKALGLQSRAQDRHTPLGQILLQMGAITSDQLLTVLDLQRHSRTLLQAAGTEQALSFPAAHLAEADLTVDLPAELVYSASPVPVETFKPEAMAWAPQKAVAAENVGDPDNLLIRPLKPLGRQRVLPQATPATPAHPAMLGPIPETAGVGLPSVPAASTGSATQAAPAPLAFPQLAFPEQGSEQPADAPTTPQIGSQIGSPIDPAGPDPRKPRTPITRIVPAASARSRFSLLQSLAAQMHSQTEKTMPSYRFVVAIGTRPEAVKLAPVIQELRARASQSELPDPVFVCATGQHAAMVKEVLAFYDVSVQRDLEVLSEGQSLAAMSARILNGFADVLAEVQPEWVLVQGDTATTGMAALAAFYAGIKVAHLEAGLRTNNLYQPFPEEFNRRMVSIFAAVHFAATPSAKHNLLREGVPEHSIVITGNTGIDALHQSAERLGLALGTPNPPPLSRPLRILVTAHRRENLDTGIDNLCRALVDLTANHPGRYQIVWPLHPNPAVGDRARSLLEKTPGVTLIPAVTYDRLLELLSLCDLVITDSGGIQEEAPSFSTPVLILRETTERPEGVEEGLAWLVGCNPTRIVDTVERLTGKLMAGPFQVETNPYGDGNASRRIASFFAGDPVQEFAAPSSRYPLPEPADVRYSLQ